MMEIRNWTAPASIALSLLLSLTPARAAEHQVHYGLAQHAIEGYVMPRLAAFETAAKALADTTAAFCTAPDEAARAPLTSQFSTALLAWAEVEIIRTGPATRDGRAQRIAFWPDPRGTMERQLRAALAQRQPELETPGALRGQSAALQGFPALEFLLADNNPDIAGADADSRYRCRVASAIAVNIAALAHEITEGWARPGGWRDHMLRPGSDNPDFPSATTSATDIFKSLTTSLQAIIESQIQPLIIASQDRASGKQPKSPAQAYKRLGLSQDYLLANIRACRALYLAAHLPGYLDATDPEQAKLLGLIDTAFSQTVRQVASKSWVDLANDGNGRAAEARAASSMLSAARRIISTSIAGAAEISLGFNELDGD